jgi:hypothetical protein
MTPAQFAQAKQLIAEGLTQRQAAARLGIPRSTLGDRLRAETLAVQRPPAAHAPPAAPAMTFVAVPGPLMISREVPAYIYLDGAHSRDHTMQIIQIMQNPYVGLRSPQ